MHDAAHKSFTRALLLVVTTACVTELTAASAQAGVQQNKGGVGGWWWGGSLVYYNGRENKKKDAWETFGSNVCFIILHQSESHKNTNANHHHIKSAHHLVTVIDDKNILLKKKKKVKQRSTVTLWNLRKWVHGKRVLSCDQKYLLPPNGKSQEHCEEEGSGKFHLIQLCFTEERFTGWCDSYHISTALCLSLY